MTLLHIEGFEGIVSLASATTQVATEDDTLEFLEKHYGGRLSFGVNQFHIRKGDDGKTHALGTGLDASGGVLHLDYWFEGIRTEDDTFTIGFRAKFRTSADSGQMVSIVGRNEPAGLHINVFLNSNRSLSVKRGGSVLATTGIDVITADTWHYIELQTRIHNTLGTYELKVDGVSELSAGPLDTEDGTVHGDPAGVRFSGFDGSAGTDADTYMLDDIYILDGLGSLNNDFLGPFRVHLLNLAAVSASDFAKYGAGTNEVTSVADLPFDPAEGIDSVNTSTNEQRYTVIGFHTDAIKGVQISSRSGNTANKTQTVQVKHKIDSSAATDTGSSYTIIDAATHRGFFSTHEVDPNTSALWTKTNLNAATYGVEIG